MVLSQNWKLVCPLFQDMNDPASTISVNKLTATAGSLKIHNHLMADGVEYANEFKGEFLSTSGTMDGIAAHYHLGVSSTGVLRSIIGVAYLDSGCSLTGTSGTGSWISGILGSASVSGTLDGTAVMVVGVYGELGSMTGATLTACSHMAAIYGQSKMTKVPSSGESEILLMAHGGGGTLAQAVYLDGSDHVALFMKALNVGTLSAHRSTPNQTATCDGYLKCSVEGHTLYIPLYNACTLT